MPKKTKNDKVTKQDSIDERIEESSSLSASSSAIESPMIGHSRALMIQKATIQSDTIAISSPKAKSSKAAKVPKATPQSEKNTDRVSKLGALDKSGTSVVSSLPKKPHFGDLISRSLITDELDVKSPKKGAFGRDQTIVLPIPSRVSKVYKLINKATGSLGGNGYDGAIYGELTMHSMQKIVNVLIEKCEMTSNSRFIDVGSGLGKPNFHVAQYPGVRISVGIELETIRWKLAMHNLSSVLSAVSPEWADLNGSIKTNAALYGGISFLAGDMDEAASTDPFTHIYMYDLGFPPPLQQAIAEKFNDSCHAEYLISYRPPARVIEEYGYDVELIDQMPTNMHGSGEVHTCYFYRRSSMPHATIARPGCSKVILPARPGTDDQAITLVTADLFKDAVISASGVSSFHNILSFSRSFQLTPPLYFLSH